MLPKNNTVSLSSWKLSQNIFLIQISTLSFCVQKTVFTGGGGCLLYNLCRWVLVELQGKIELPKQQQWVELIYHWCQIANMVLRSILNTRMQVHIKYKLPILSLSVKICSNGKNQYSKNYIVICRHCNCEHRVVLVSFALSFLLFSLKWPVYKGRIVDWKNKRSQTLGRIQFLCFESWEDCDRDILSVFRSLLLRCSLRSSFLRFLSWYDWWLKKKKKKNC